MEKFIGKSLWLEDKKILVISDLHLGYEEALAEQGVFIPRGMYKIIIKELEEIFNSVGKVEYLIVLGDLRHEFSGISNQEWKEVLGFLDFIKTKAKKIILIKGNHDNMLQGIVKQQGLEVRNYFILGDYSFFHGDKIYPEIFDKKIKTWVVGHMHPSVVIKEKEGIKKEKYKCFLAGKYKDKKLVILPSFFPLIEGSDINFYDINLGFDIKLDNFKVYVVSDNLSVLNFGKFKSLY